MHLGKAMTEAGIDYVSFTAPAHGSSTDDKTHMLEFVTSIEFMAETYGPFDVIVGHSLGGTAAMNAIKNGVGANKVVIIGSHAKISTTIKDFSKKLQLNSKTEKSLIKHLQKNYHKDYERYGIERIASETDIEALIIHDRQDKEAHFSNAEAIHKAFQQSEIYETNGLGHTRILASKEVVNKIIDFIQK
jgi:pimeloyl-ACP methyl ester carboxylesterase